MTFLDNLVEEGRDLAESHLVAPADIRNVLSALVHKLDTLLDPTAAAATAGPTAPVAAVDERQAELDQATAELRAAQARVAALEASGQSSDVGAGAAESSPAPAPTSEQPPAESSPAAPAETSSEGS